MYKIMPEPMKLQGPTWATVTVQFNTVVIMAT